MAASAIAVTNCVAWRFELHTEYLITEQVHTLEYGDEYASNEFGDYQLETRHRILTDT